MPKPPPNLPDRGDACRVRGRDVEGVLEKMDVDGLWCTVRLGPDRVKLFHLYELERISP